MTMSRRSLIAATALTALATSRGWSQTPQPGPAPAAMRTALRTRFAGRFTGDFDAMLDRRLIRLVVPYSPTLFFEDKGAIYGTAANGAQLFEQWINKTFGWRTAVDRAVDPGVTRQTDRYGARWQRRHRCGRHHNLRGTP